MNTTQSIIVYRNPLEQMFWEGGGSAYVWPVLVGVFAFFLVFGCIQSFIIDRLFPWSRRRVITSIALLVSAAAGVGTVMYMVG